MNKTKFNTKCLFCAKYIFDYGYTLADIAAMKEQAKDLDIKYSIVEAQDENWEKIAKGLREIWPPGEKDGKYSWRDSVSNVSRRLQTMWSELIPDKHYTEDQILMVARKYVAQFQDNTKYMRTLKYFILKQEKDIGPDGKFRVYNSSILAQMLDNQDVQGWFTSDILNDNYPEWVGEII